MLSESVKLQVGKSYPISVIIKEIDNAPDIKLGHLVINVINEHVYHPDRQKLEKMAKKIEQIILERGREYERLGKKFVPSDTVLILGMEDPYQRYYNYDRFYSGIEPQILKAIFSSKKNQIASPINAMIEEAKKAGVKIESEKEFLDGMGIYFKRRGIHTKIISDGNFILFERTTSAAVRKEIISEVDEAKMKYEKYKEFDRFYENFYMQIIGAITNKKGGVAAPIAAIIGEAKKMNYPILGREEDFLKGMSLYFEIKNIRSDKTDDDQYIVFKKK